VSSPSPRPILLAYDGSPAARRAVKEAGVLWPGARAVVVTVWVSAGQVASAGLVALSPAVVADAVGKLDDATERAAGALAEEGTRHAAEAGLQAGPLVVEAAGSIWATLVETAESQDAAAVVVGSRGRTEMQAFLLGSVTHGLVHHCPRPVVVVRGEGAES
jgi:nucleotide-binding universal stress UspA family protein